MKRALTLLPVAALAIAACGSDDSVSIDSAWARTSAAGQTTGAIYFDLTVDADDTLITADVPDSIADRAEIHEVVAADTDDGDMAMDDDSEDMGDMAGSDDMESGDMDGTDMGAMVMQELTDGLPLTADETVSFEPGGYHVMLLDIAEPLEVGDEIELTLEFAEAGSTTLTVEVAESAP